MREKLSQELKDQLDHLTNDVAQIKRAIERISPEIPEGEPVGDTEVAPPEEPVNETSEASIPSADGEEASTGTEAEETASQSMIKLEELRAQLDEALGGRESDAVTIHELQGANQRLQGEIAAERSSMADSDRKFQELHGMLEQAQEEKNTSDAHCQSLQETINSHEEEIRNLRDTTDNFQTKTEQLENDLAASRNQSAQIQATLEEALRENEELQAKVLLNNRLSSIIWPSFLSTEEFAAWKQSLTKGLFAEPPSSGVMGIVTSLFSYNALSRIPEQGSKRLIDVVYDLGLALYSWFEESGLDSESSFQNANLWANAINRANEENFTILVPEPDTPFDRRTMVSYSSETNASPDVGGAKSWCIKDSDGRIQRQATVILT